MIGTYEKRQVANYLHNAQSWIGNRMQRARLLAQWCADQGESLGIIVDHEDIAPILGKEKCCWKKILVIVRTALDEAMKNTKDASPSAIALNIDFVCKFFRLDEVESKLLELSVLANQCTSIGELIGNLNEGGRQGVATVVSALIGADANETAARLKATSKLIESGLLVMDYHVEGQLSVPDRLLEALETADSTRPEALIEALVGNPLQAELEWDDFDHLAEDREFILDLLGGALRSQEHGINILVYGPPGTGKTEFCKAVSRRLSSDLFLVGTTDECNNEPNRRQRVSQLILAQQILCRRNDAIVLFDEMEDVLGNSRDRISKVYIHSVLEQAKVPTLWTCNSLSEFDPALLRRMSMAIEFRTPPVAFRERIWRRTLERCSVHLDDSDIQALAHDLDAPPALAATAARAAQLAGGGTDRVRRAATAITKAMRGGSAPIPSEHLSGSFNERLVNSCVDLANLAAQLTRSQMSLGFSLCLFGPPGTGKSAYVRHIAARLGMEVLHKRASDLLDMYVGQSERNIARAFSEAVERRAFLIFDEADSLLADRTGAVHSWEVRQVNEMLTWMERHPLPFACTTNLMDRVDPASLRRFTFKAKFDYLTARQVGIAFTDFFGHQPPDELRWISMLTPGDFSLVKRKAEVLAQLDSPLALVRMLRAEADAKPGKSRPIGFGN